MAAPKKNIAGVIRDLLEPVVNELGYMLWDIVYKKEGAAWNLYIYIDKESGIDLNDCETVHRKIDVILDEADPIPDSYYLHVSSAGLERELRTPEHFDSCIGKEILVKLYNKKDYGSNTLRGILKSYDKTVLVLTTGDTEININCPDIAKTNIVADF